MLGSGAGERHTRMGGQRHGDHWFRCLQEVRSSVRQVSEREGLQAEGMARPGRPVAASRSPADLRTDGRAPAPPLAVLGPGISFGQCW